MKIWMRYILVLAIFIIAAGGAYGYWTYRHAHSSDADSAQVRMVITGFGDQLQKMPLLAPKDLIDKGMDLYYGLYVRPDLLATWKADPLNAPGRLTSSPWPDRIDITGVQRNKDGTYTVNGSIIEVANGAGGAQQQVDTVPVQFTVAKGPDGWQISGYSKL